jgi:hypothetical protein
MRPLHLSDVPDPFPTSVVSYPEDSFCVAWVAVTGAIQVITLSAFSIIFGDFVGRLLGSAHAKNLMRHDKLFLSFLVVAILSTLARCNFRAYELKEGYKGDLITHEDLFIGLEGV